MCAFPAERPPGRQESALIQHRCNADKCSVGAQHGNESFTSWAKCQNRRGKWRGKKRRIDIRVYTTDRCLITSKRGACKYQVAEWVGPARPSQRKTTGPLVKVAPPFDWSSYLQWSTTHVSLCCSTRLFTSCARAFSSSSRFSFGPFHLFGQSLP